MRRQDIVLRLLELALKAEDAAYEMDRRQKNQGIPRSELIRDAAILREAARLVTPR
jgi:hypothetical protein